MGASLALPLLLLVGSSTAQQGGGGFGGGGFGGRGGGGNRGRPGDRPNGGFMDVRDPCRQVTDEDICNEMDECSYGSVMGGGFFARETFGCRSKCLDIEDPEECDNECAWASGGGRGGDSSDGDGRSWDGESSDDSSDSSDFSDDSDSSDDSGGNGGRRLQDNFWQNMFNMWNDGRGGGGGGQNWRQLRGRCVPSAEALATGLEVTMTIYVDQECTEMLDPTENQNANPRTQCFNKEEDECEDMEDCEWEADGNMRNADPHCRPAQRGQFGGFGRPGQGGRPGGGGGRPGRRLQQWRGNGRNVGAGMGRGFRGQDFQDRGAGGNANQRGRINENPTKRIIPVIDQEGEQKCSFDARADQDQHVFRKTECPEMNVLQDYLFSDPSCEDEIAEDVDRIERGVCMPLPMPRSAQRGGRGDSDSDSDSNGRRRRFAFMDWFDQAAGGGNDNDEYCDGEFKEWNWEWETLVDWWGELTCDDGKNDENDSDEDEEPNPCNMLGLEECMDNETECEYQEGVCVWKNAPENRRNLYVIYDWQYLMINGEETEKEFCYKEGDDAGEGVYRMFEEPEDYFEAIAAAENEEECMNIGGKKWAGKKCKANKKIKCKRIGMDEKSKDNKERDCMLWSKYPDKKGKENKCKWDAKKQRCTGKITI